MASTAREKIEECMRGNGGSPLALCLVLSFLSLFYGAAVRLRNLLYSSGVLRSRRLPCRVVSIGNITAGGTGKTPVAIHVASLLKERGLKVAVLSRGYKGSAKGTSVVSDGKTLFLGPEEAGDEPYLMAKRLEGVPVIVGADRVSSGLYAIEKFSPDVLVLDDGFQHRRIARNVDVVLVDSVQGLGNGHLLPRGILREPVEGIKRADVVLVKGAGLKEGDLSLLERSGRPVFSFALKPTGVFDIKEGNVLGVEALKGRRLLAFAGLASPESFFRTLEGLGAASVKRLPFPDHHKYTAQDMALIKDSSSGEEMVVTTEKDSVKLEGTGLMGMSVYALAVEAELDDGGALRRLITEVR